MSNPGQYDSYGMPSLPFDNPYHQQLPMLPQQQQYNSQLPMLNNGNNNPNQHSTQQQQQQQQQQQGLQNQPHPSPQVPNFNQNQQHQSSLPMLSTPATQPPAFQQQQQQQQQQNTQSAAQYHQSPSHLPQQQPPQLQQQNQYPQFSLPQNANNPNNSGSDSFNPYGVYQPSQSQPQQQQQQQQPPQQQQNQYQQPQQQQQQQNQYQQPQQQQQQQNQYQQPPQQQNQYQQQPPQQQQQPQQQYNQYQQQPPPQQQNQQGAAAARPRPGAKQDGPKAWSGNAGGVSSGSSEIYKYKHPRSQAGNAQASVPFNNSYQICLTFRQAHEKNKKIADKTKRQGKAFRFVPVNHQSPAYIPCIKNVPPTHMAAAASAIVPDQRRSLRIHTDDSGRILDPNMRVCYRVLSYLIDQDTNAIFTQPVDPELLKCPTYFEIIKHPMDFGTIRSDLVNNKITTPDHFDRMVRLVFANATTFNPPEHFVHKYAKTLESIYAQRYYEAWNPPAVQAAPRQHPTNTARNTAPKKTPTGASKRPLKHETESEDDDDDDAAASQATMVALKRGNTNDGTVAQHQAIPGVMPGMVPGVMPGMQPGMMPPGGMMQPGMMPPGGMMQPGMMPPTNPMQMMQQMMQSGMMAPTPEMAYWFQMMMPMATVNPGMMPQAVIPPAQAAAPAKGKNKVKKSRTNGADTPLVQNPIQTAASVAGGELYDAVNPNDSLLHQAQIAPIQQQQQPAIIPPVVSNTINDEQVEILQDLASSLPDNAIDGLLDILRQYLPNLDPDNIDVATLTFDQYENACAWIRAKLAEGEQGGGVNDIASFQPGQFADFTNAHGHDGQSDQEYD